MADSLEDPINTHRNLPQAEMEGNNSVDHASGGREAAYAEVHEATLSTEDTGYENVPRENNYTPLDRLV